MSRKQAWNKKQKAKAQPVHKSSGKAAGPASASRVGKNIKSVSPYLQEITDLRPGEDQLMVTFKGRIPSVNMLTLDVHATKRRASTGMVKTFKASVKRLLTEVKAKLHLPKSDWYSLYICIAMSLYDDKGNIRKSDASNFIKVPEDAITEALGFDDSRFLKVAVEKCDYPEAGAANHPGMVWSFTITKA